MTKWRRALPVAFTAVLYAVAPVLCTPASAQSEDPALFGGVALFDAAGVPVRSGDNLASWAAYAVPAEVFPDKGRPTILSAAQADPTKPAADWPVTKLAELAADTSASEDLPGPLAAISYGVVPVGTADLAGLVQEGQIDVQLRLSYNSTGTAYWATDLLVDAATGHWEQAEAPAQPATVSLSEPTLELTTDGAAVTLRSTVNALDGGARPTGWVELFDGDTDRGLARYDPVTGEIVATDAPTAGEHQYRFVLTAVAPLHYAPASSAATSCMCGKAIRNATPTTVTVSAVPAAGNLAFGLVAITATVLPLGVAGTVNFTTGGQPLASVPVAGGLARFETNALGVGAHTISATFSPTDGDSVDGSTASSTAFTLVEPPAGMSAPTPADPSTSSGHPAMPSDHPAVSIQAAARASAEVPAGQLTLATPYSPQRPLELGRLALDDSGAKLVAIAHLGTVASAARDGITVTDTRASDPGWSASLMASDFGSGTDTISARNAGLVDVRAVPVPGLGGGDLGTARRPIKVHDIAPAPLVVGVDGTATDGLANQPKIFATAKSGRGTVYIIGDLLLNAPVTALSGNYAATLTFTVS